MTLPKEELKARYLAVLDDDNCGGIVHAGQIIEVSHQTLHRWRKEDPEFDQAVKDIRFGWEGRMGEAVVLRVIEAALLGAPHEVVVRGGKDEADEVVVLRRYEQRAVDRVLDRFAGWADQAAGRLVREKFVSFEDREGNKFALTEVIKARFMAARSEFLDLEDAREVEEEHGEHGYEDGSGGGGHLPGGEEGPRVPE